MLSRFSAVLAFALLLWAGPAAATTMRFTSVEELTASSELVVRGRVLAKEARASKSGRRIHTLVTVQVGEAWKGRAPETVTLYVPGGSLNGISQVVQGMPTFDDGEDVVLFLREGGGARWLVSGAAAGKLRVDDRGLAAADLRGINVVDRPRVAAPERLGGSPDPAVPQRVDELRARVQAAAR